MSNRYAGGNSLGGFTMVFDASQERTAPSHATAQKSAKSSDPMMIDDPIPATNVPAAECSSRS
jgi:hypothetical protein